MGISSPSWWNRGRMPAPILPEGEAEELAGPLPSPRESGIGRRSSRAPSPVPPGCLRERQRRAGSALPRVAGPTPCCAAWPGGCLVPPARRALPLRERPDAPAGGFGVRLPPDPAEETIGVARLALDPPRAGDEE